MNGRIHRRLAALEPKRLQQFPCCERAQRRIKTSAVGSEPTSECLSQLTAIPRLPVIRDLQNVASGRNDCSY